MKTNLIKRVIDIAAALTITLAIGAGGASAQGSVPVPRITDNGTVRDGGLVWLKNANCFGSQHWDQATSSAASLQSGSCGLTDGSTAGQWRLPTKEELMMRKQRGFNNVQSSFYWSSSIYANYYPNVWVVNLINGNVKNYHKNGDFYVWPVRSGQ